MKKILHADDDPKYRWLVELFLKIVKGLVNAHGGMVDLSYKNKIFTVKIVI